MVNKLTDIFWRIWPYLVTGLLCIAGAAALYKGMGEIFAILLVGIPFVIFLMRNPVYVIVTQFFFGSIVRFLTENMGLSGLLVYFTDLLTVILLIQIIINFPQMGYKLKVIAIPGIFLLAIFIVNIVASIYNNVQLINFVWGIRLNFRFIIFLVGCIMFINQRVIDLLWKVFIVLVYLQLIICTVQFFILDYISDAIGGSFGTRGTSFIVYFFAIGLLFAFARYNEGQCRQSTVWFVLLAGLYVCTINEGKAIVMFDAVIFLVIILQNGITLKKIFWILGAIVCFFLFTYLLGAIYPAFNEFFSLEKLLGYATTEVYYGSAINRFNGPEYFSRYFDNMQDWFGVGLGNACESQIPLLQGDYYQAFFTTSYYWFYIAYYYMESGYVGLCLHIGFYLSFLIVAYRIRNKVSGTYLAFLVGMVALCLLSICYSLGLRSEVIGYTFYLFLSVPLAMAVNEEHEYHNYPTRLDKQGVQLNA